jgi:putative acetyltransferase
MVIIREEKPGDEQRIRIVNQRAFGRIEEADIVDKLRRSCPNSISLVALSRDQIVGHILFTPVAIQAEGRKIEGLGLASMVALPQFQRQGIGSQLVKTGLEVIEKAKSPFVIVLGHPTYYPRFGFVPASRYGIKSEYENVPDEAFMILVLDQTALKSISCIAKYRPEFASAM